MMVLQTWFNSVDRVQQVIHVHKFSTSWMEVVIETDPPLQLPDHTVFDHHANNY